MKKLALFLCSVLVVGTTASAKEMVVEPTNSKEVMVEPVVMEEIVIVPVAATPWGYVEVGAGWDFWSEYGTETFTKNPDAGGGPVRITEPHSVKLSKDTDESGYEVKIEMYKSWDNFDLGLGLAYQDHAKRDSNSYHFENNSDVIREVSTQYTDVHVSGGEYKSMPIYLTGKYRINYWNWEVVPYLKANVGYSFNFDEKDIHVNTTANGGPHRLSTSVDDGWYWAAGIGMEYKNFTMDVMYGINYADMDWKGPNEGQSGSFSNDYERVTLSVGYKFNIW